MSAWWAWVAIVVLLVPAATAQTGAGSPAPPQPIVVLEDAANDVVLRFQGDHAVPESTFGGMDLRSVAVQEQEASITFVVQVQEIVSQSTLGLDAPTVHVYFDHHGTRFRIEVRDSVSLDGVHFTYAYLEFFDEAEEAWYYLRVLSPISDPAAGTYTLDVPRDALRDEDGAAPFPGRALTGFWAESSALFSFPVTFNDMELELPYAYDRMPDNGASTVDVPIVYGLQQTGSARLYTDQPMRASNGEASTFIFNVTAHNVGETGDRFWLEHATPPRGWTVTFPVPTFELAPDERLAVPVIVSTPFAHQHGAAETFVVRLTADGDGAALGQVELGLLFLEVPQPSGHHPQMWLHSWDLSSDDPVFNALITVFEAVFFPFPYSYGYWSTLPDDPLSDGVPIEAYTFRSPFGEPGVSEYWWSMGLGQGLRMGLDFDVERPIELDLAIEATQIVQAAAVQIALIHASREDGEDWQYVTLLAHNESVGDLAAGDIVDLAVSALPPQEADLLPYRDAQYLYMDVRLTGSPIPYWVAESSPLLQPGGILVLPLLEYRDPVDDAFAGSGGLHLAVDGVQERLVNPGGLVRFPVTLHGGDSETRADLSVVGPDASWARVQPARLDVQPAGAASTDVWVRVPADAQDGHVADLLLEAVDPASPDRRALLRLLVEVDTDMDHPDDAAAAGAADDEGSPVGAWVPLVALAAAALVARRRR